MKISDSTQLLGRNRGKREHPFLFKHTENEQDVTALEHRIMELLAENQKLHQENVARQHWINPADCVNCRMGIRTPKLHKVAAGRN